MSKELRFPDPDPDHEVANVLQPLLTPPGNDAAYWDGLQRRIMARVAAAGTPQTWWSLSPGAARAGLIAAGLAILALGALAMQTKEIQQRMAFQAMTDTDLEVARLIPGIDEPFGKAPAAPASTTAPASAVQR